MMPETDVARLCMEYGILLLEYRRNHVCHCSQHDVDRSCFWCRVDIALESKGDE